MNRVKGLIILLLFPAFLFAEPVRITGTAPGAEGKRIELITYSDLITFTEKTLAIATVEADGHFSLTCDTDQTLYILLSIDFHRGELFIQPSKNYQVEIRPMNYNETKEINPFLQSAKLEITLIDNDPPDLNVLIDSFNNTYNQFLLENFNALYRDRNKMRLDSFRMKVVMQFGNYKDQPYLTSYAKYKIASLVQLSQSMNQAEIGKMYFTFAPVQYRNVEYMDFFNQYFSKYMTATCRALKFTDYKSILSSQESYPKMMKALEADSTLRKPQLRELVMLKGLMEMYGIPGYKNDEIIRLLGKVAAESWFPENQEVARNMITLLTKLQMGSKAPDFRLQSTKHQEVSLSEFRGKPVVLNFWTTYCQACINEMDLLKPIYDQYHDKAVFISISADRDFSKMSNYVKMKSDFVWTFLHIGDQYNLLKEFDVKSYPLYVLIDRDGNIAQYPAATPGLEMETELQKLTE